MLKDKIALITGGTQGIGLAVVKKMVSLGATVYFTSRNKDRAKETEDIFKNEGLSATGLGMDISKTEDVREGIGKILETHNAIHILVNNAGIARDNLLMRMKREEWDEVFATNLTGVFHVTQGILRTMLKQRYGRIVNITSVVGQMGNAGQTNYCASKAGIIGFTKSLAREVATRNITVNAVAPGLIETPMIAGLSDEQRADMIEKIPMDRIGTPDDVAYAVIFLAGAGASYITGQVIAVNGGMYM